MGTRNAHGFVRLASAGALLVAVIAGRATGQGTDRVSVDSSGTQGNDHSIAPSVSADGRFVAFGSDANNLVVGDTNGVHDIFVHDELSSTTERVSVDSNGTQGNGPCFDSRVSGDGRIVVFGSAGSDLVTGDTNGRPDIFLRDLQLGTTERVSIASNGAQANEVSFGPSVSSDGRFVAFFSLANNLVGGDTNGAPDVFVRDRQLGLTMRVSVDSNGVQGNGPSFPASISGDGSSVAFGSSANNLVSADTNGVNDIFVHHIPGGITERVSVATSGTQGNLESGSPSISADGRFVAFDSIATNLVTGDTNGSSDIFVRDVQLDITVRVSVDSLGAQSNGHSGSPSISNDGGYVAFHSHASNLVQGDTNFFQDIYIRYLSGGVTERVSVATDGSQGNGESGYVSLSAAGGFLAFQSAASNLVSGDTNGILDIFVRDRGGMIGDKYCTANANSTGAPADLSASGSASSGAGNLTLTSMPVPNQNGIFFHGMNQSQIPFGNGFQCTTGGLVRGEVVVAAGNLAMYFYDNSDAKRSLSAFIGSTRNFQHWFRDPAGGGALFNTSNAISIAVLP